MENQTNLLEVTTESGGAKFTFTLKDFYFNCGGQIEINTTLSPGKANEKALPPSFSTASFAGNGNFREEGGLDTFIAEHPEFIEIIAKALQKAAEPYQG